MDNTYGIVRPGVIDPARDVEIWYSYRPRRTGVPADNKFKKIKDVSSVLIPAEIESGAAGSGQLPDKLPGMYRLSLPVSIFGNIGIYTVYILPKQIPCQILNVGSLAAYPEVKGIIVNPDGTDLSGYMHPNALNGFRVEYLDVTDSTTGKEERQQYSRLVTSSNRCEATAPVITSVNANIDTYRFTDSGSLLFLTLSPTDALYFQANATPYIGTNGQRIIISNTKFDPLCVEVEICRNDADTLAVMIGGDQVREMGSGLLYTYNEDGEIASIREFSTVKSDYSKKDIMEVRVNKDSIPNVTPPDIRDYR